MDELFNENPVPFLIKPFDIYMVHAGLQLAAYQAKLEKQIHEIQEEVNKLKI